MKSQTNTNGPAARFGPLRQGASEQVAHEIRRYVHVNHLESGDRLGTEQQLAAEFGVSRPTLREALRLLASSYLIRASQGPGGGIFVASTPNEGMGRALSDSIATMLAADSVSLHDLLQARTYLEVPLAGLAAVNADGQTVLGLQEAIEMSEGHGPGTPEFGFGDAEFHRRLAAAAGNDLMLAFTSWAFDVLQPSLVAYVDEVVSGSDLLAQHRRIMRAVERRQASSAERAMRHHLDYLRDIVRRLDGKS